MQVYPLTRAQVKIVLKATLNLRNQASLVLSFLKHTIEVTML